MRAVTVQCVDINVLVYAHRPESPDHDAYRAWLDHARADRESLGLAPIVASGFMRIVTHPKIFKEPTPLDIAIEFVEVMKASPAVSPVLPGPKHWAIFIDLCRRLRLKGNH